MSAILGVGVAGTILTLVGAIATFYYRSKYLNEKLDSQKLSAELEQEVTQKKTLKSQYDSLKESTDREIKGLRQREDERRKKIRDLLTTCRDPRVLNRELNSLFPPS